MLICPWQKRQLNNIAQQAYHTVVNYVSNKFNFRRIGRHFADAIY